MQTCVEFWWVHVRCGASVRLKRAFCSQVVRREGPRDFAFISVGTCLLLSIVCITPVA